MTTVVWRNNCDDVGDVVVLVCRIRMSLFWRGLALAGFVASGSRLADDGRTKGPPNVIHYGRNALAGSLRTELNHAEDIIRLVDLVVSESSVKCPK